VNARKHLAVFIGLSLLALALLVPAAAPADFGVEPGSFSAVAINKDGTRDFQAGSHPFNYSVGFTLNQDSNQVPEGDLRTLFVELPPGLLGNPEALPKCPTSDFVGHASICTGDTQIGIVRFTFGGGIEGHFPINLMRAPLGVPSRFGFSIVGSNSFQEATLRSDGDYGITVSDLSIPSIELQSITEEFWGVPAAAGHDNERSCVEGIHVVEGCSSESPAVPFLSLPTSCAEPAKTKISIASSEEPDVFVSEEVETSDESGTPTAFDGCNALPFEPSVVSQPTTNLADTPTGLNFKLHIPQPPGVEQGAGTVETCSSGQWQNEPTEYQYRWLRNSVPIPGETSPTYVVGEADASSVLQCEVIAINAGGQGYAVSPPLTIAPAPAVSPPRPGLIKAEREGFFQKNEGTVVCNPGLWEGEPSFAYRWFENGTEVPGATGAKYAPAEEAFTLQCEVTGSNGGGSVAAFSRGETSFPEPEHQLPSPNTQFPPKASPDEAEIPLSSAHLKDTTVTLPQGLVINPSVANGLAACDEAQIGFVGTGFPAPNPIHFTKTSQSCPAASKIGTVSVTTPLLDHKTTGALYIAKPFENPFGSFMALYLVVEDEQTGIVAKLAGKVSPDPQTGQLTTSFENNPQLPLEDIELSLFGGPKAALKTPLACATYTTNTTLVPWSTPEGQTEHPTDAFQTSVAAGGNGACPTSEAGAPVKTSFDAGTISPAAGSYSPFVLKIARQDGTQRIKQIDTTLPKGLTGKLAGIPYCPEAAIAQAKSREAPGKGVLEQGNPSCPAASEVGTVTVGAGAGVTPYYTTGHAYLAGPYEGAQLSIVIITPAVAGPFDLGAVLVRTPLYVNSETAQIHAVSDPLPQIIEGVPLDIRSISLRLERPDFTLNPTSCEPTQVAGSMVPALGSPAALSSPFQVGGCRALKFAPKFNFSLKGPTRRGGFPAFKAVLNYPQGSNYANTAYAQVTLPHSEFVEQAHFQTICTRVQFAANACPARSVYGKAKAITPLLDKPLEGNVYLRSSSHKLPDLVIALRGQVDVDLAGKVDTGKNGGIRTTFEAAPDAPVKQVILQMQGGKKGLFVNSENLCRKEQRAISELIAQNGKLSEAQPLIKNDCKGKAKAKKKAGKGHGGKR
jgi:hypothetical protein